MPARLIDGAAVARQVRDEVGARDAELNVLGITPGLAVVIVGDDPASQVYVRNKVKTAHALGLVSEMVALPASVTQRELMATVARLNAAPEIHGFLVQMPLPAHLDASEVTRAIDPLKDVDGFHRDNIGALVQNEPGLRPCTPNGVMRLLAAAGIPVKGAHAVVIGRSNIVGKPMAMLLLHAGATVTICHSQTKNLPEITRQADILVAAIGKPRFVTRDMVKPGAAVIDVGINRGPEGKLCGDVDFDDVIGVAGAITPVPGGVGPMTVAMLIGNAVAAAGRSTEMASAP
ncbi:MAG: bifunctional methylenetetrahydrofolate dehydrogenase/methenyltetrahydrofolate cyclohydrolase FolD [Betaproteobacteria bacterium]